MHNFTFNGVDLSAFGGRILQAPLHTVANRNIELVKIYGQNGDEIIDNESYDNVDFSLKIAFLPIFGQQTARQLAYAIIDWLAPLQNGYYIYRDTYNPGYFTKAVLKNIGEIERTLPTQLSATLKFNRVPYWYRDDGVNAVEFYNGGADNILTNPEQHSAEPIYQFVYLRNVPNVTVFFIINGTTNSLFMPVDSKTYYLDNVKKQTYYYNNGQKIYVSDVLLPNLPSGNNTIKFNIEQTLSVGSFHLNVIPNWRRL